MVFYIHIQDICVTHALGGEETIYGITREQGGPIPSLFDKCTLKSPQFSELNDHLQFTEAAIKNFNLNCLINMTTYPHKKPNHLPNLVKFIRRGLPRVILPLNKIDVKHNLTQTTADSMVLIPKG